MSELDPRLEEWVSQLRREPEVRVEALAAIRDRIEVLSATRPHVVATRPRVFVLSPARAAAAAIALVAATSLVWAAVPRGGTASRGNDGLAPVQFVLHASGARSVTIVGDFNDWDVHATPLTHAGESVWSVLVHLPPGPVTYSFLVDGTEWRADPTAAPSAADFGRPSSVAYVSAAEADR